jgi:hypothetical protein
MKRLGWGLAFAFLATAAVAQPSNITKTDVPVVIDGKLDDPAWQNATKYETWYETNPGDNIEPKVKTVGYVTYDAKFLYVGIESFDPKPSDIRAVYGDHDQISGSSDDFSGIIIDSRNDGKTAIEFFVTARGVQYDAAQNDTGGGEDSSPDFFWDSEARIHDQGWTAEMRIPFSSLRYDNPNPQEWGLILYRNMPRDRRYQIFTAKLPRGGNCFVCHFGKIAGLRDLPSGDHMVVAPYVTAHQSGEPRNGVLGSEFVNHQVGTDGGVDLKWNPTADMAVDATLNPDFSQVEADSVVISTNERFAIFLPEKRPFFLEGVEHFATPIQAVYTRTITSPRFGGRTTGRTGDYAYTLLVAQDRGGGLTILPGAEESDFAIQDFKSTEFVGRLRRDFGNSFVGVLATTRESEGGAHNRVFGPDFQWRMGKNSTLTGQYLLSRTVTPDRPDLAEEWDGRKLNDHAGYLQFTHSTDKHDFFINYNDFGQNFRADNGFVPQVGYRASYSEYGHTWRPTGFFNRVRAYAFGEYDQTQDGDLLYRLASVGFGADGKFRSFLRLRFARDTVAYRGSEFDRDRLYYQLNFSVNQVLTNVGFDGWVGDNVDFSSKTEGDGASVNANMTLRPTDHLQTTLSGGVVWLTVNDDFRLFTAQVQRLRATYTFNSRMFVRALVQHLRNDRVRRSDSLASQLLFAYKLNWQTVFYVGYGDLRDVDSVQVQQFEPSSRQLFAKVSYAFQR